jgi:hypothetical protein
LPPPAEPPSSAASELLTTLQAFIKPNDWNQYHLIVRGNVLIHVLNGHVMSEVINDDAPSRKFKGLIGVQVHVGPPMKVEYRNILLKPLP